MTNYWPVIVILAIAFLVTIIISLTNKNKRSDFKSNYQNKEFENFLNVLKDATDTKQNSEQITEEQQSNGEQKQSKAEDKKEE